MIFQEIVIIIREMSKVNVKFVESDFNKNLMSPNGSILKKYKRLVRIDHKSHFKTKIKFCFLSF